MKKALAIAGILALSITPTASFACDLSGAQMSRADLSRTQFRDANLSGITATNLGGCPWRLPSGWVCENNSLIQR